MGASEHSVASRDIDIDLAALWRLAWDYKYLILVFVVLSSAVAVFIALNSPPVYHAETSIIEVQDNKMGGVKSLAGQLGGLASIAGINLGANGESREAQAILGSRRLVEEFIKRHELLPELSQRSRKPLTLWLAVTKFRKSVLTVRIDKRAGTTTVTMDWDDPAKAARWANEFVTLANELVRTRAMDDSTRNIAYLKNQIAQTDVVEVQRLMYNLIESETKTLMLASGRAEYAFTVVDPAVAPEIRVGPHRKVIVAVGIVLGLLLGLGVALIHRVLRRKLAVAR